MSQRQLKRSLEYKQKVREYALNLSKRYRLEIAGVFIRDVGLAQKRILENNEAGTCAPYIMLGQKVVLRELYFTSGPAKYCMVYDIFDDYIGLIIVHPETPDGMTAVFDLETSYFSQGQGNQGFERRRSPLRRTIKSAD